MTDRREPLDRLAANPLRGAVGVMKLGVGLLQPDQLGQQDWSSSRSSRIRCCSDVSLMGPGAR
ncbi:MAG: hypothetical protein ACYSU2_19855 [Planctomycetota bacterium]